MSNIIAIVGESGSGKSTSMRNLDPAKTVILSPISKPLPFKGKKYSKESKNYFENVNALQVRTLMQNISQKAPDVNTIIIDDFQYLMSSEFMARAKEVGYNKFTDIGKNAYDVVVGATQLRDGINVYFLCHEELSENSGRRKIKTIGKMLDEKITLEGLFTIVLFTDVSKGSYTFITQSDGTTTAKSPLDMFPLQVENDLNLINEKIKEYYE
jgi:energy-coupling factor transporter ATP-binding protein EcfA2